MQPMHNAHLYVVEKMCKENRRAIIILGSSNKESMLRNPFPIELRIKFLKEAITTNIGKQYADKIEVYELPDWTQEGDIQNVKEWGKYLYYNIVSRIKSKKFGMYFSDTPEIMLNWFDADIQARIDFIFMERSTIFEGLSATKIRQAFEDNDLDYIKKYCPPVIVDAFPSLRNAWLRVLKYPINDFSMS
jgi:phosphopantetheine adenylyltransferase